jgi:hypothetical protein
MISLPGRSVLTEPRQTERQGGAEHGARVRGS